MVFLSQFCSPSACSAFKMEVRSCHCSAQTPHGLPISLSESSRSCNDAPAPRHLLPHSFLGFISYFSPLLSPFSLLTFLLFSNMQTPTSGPFHLSHSPYLQGCPQWLSHSSLSNLYSNHTFSRRIFPDTIFKIVAFPHLCTLHFIFSL